MDERYVEGVDYDEDDLADQGDGEWQEGECDLCLGSTAEDLARAEAGELIPVCACAVGQGAPADECRCGPEEG